MGKMASDGFFVPANPDLFFLDPTFLDCQVLRSPNFWISRSPDLQIPRSEHSQIFRFPDFQTPPPDEFSDPNLTPLPTHPEIKYVARALAAIWTN